MLLVLLVLVWWLLLPCRCFDGGCGCVAVVIVVRVATGVLRVCLSRQCGVLLVVCIVGGVGVVGVVGVGVFVVGVVGGRDVVCVMLLWVLV